MSGDLISAYHRRLTGTDEAEKLKAATAWSVWELSTSRLHVDPAYIARRMAFTREASNSQCK